MLEKNNRELLEKRAGRFSVGWGTPRDLTGLPASTAGRVQGGLRPSVQKAVRVTFAVTLRGHPLGLVRSSVGG